MNSPLDEIEILSVSEIVNPWLDKIDSRWLCGVSFYLESLRLTHYLPSFLIAGFPETFASDTTAKKTIKLMELEANFPKTGLQILRRKDGESQWLGLSKIVLQNRGRESQVPLIIPYLTVNQIKILSRDDRLAVKLWDFGDGLIGQGEFEPNRPIDYLQIEGEWRLDLDIAYAAKRPTDVHQTQQAVSINAIQLMSSNPFRGYFEIQNRSSSTPIYYGFSQAAVETTPFELKPGQLYYPGNPEGFVPSSEFWAKTYSGIAEISIAEWSYI